MKEKGQPSNATSNINKLNLALGNTLTGPKISTIKRWHDDILYHAILEYMILNMKI